MRAATLRMLRRLQGPAYSAVPIPGSGSAAAPRFPIGRSAARPFDSFQVRPGFGAAPEDVRRGQQRDVQPDPECATEGSEWWCRRCDRWFVASSRRLHARCAACGSVDIEDYPGGF
jgi:hypothetical protein